MVTTLHIDVYVDLICPWCLIGKRYLDEALVQFQKTELGVAVEVVWHSVQLLPDVPTEGWDFETFYLKRLGSHENIRQRQAQINTAARRASFQIDFTGIPRMPNTFQAHQLLHFASTRLAAEKLSFLLEHLFVSYFSFGVNLGDRDSLCRIAAIYGLNVAEVNAWITDGTDQSMDRNVLGVPYFVFNRKVTLSGAQPPEVLLDAMCQASRHASFCQDAGTNPEVAA